MKSRVSPGDEFFCARHSWKECSPSTAFAKLTLRKHATTKVMKHRNGEKPFSFEPRPPTALPLSYRVVFDACGTRTRFSQSDVVPSAFVTCCRKGGMTRMLCTCTRDRVSSCISGDTILIAPHRMPFQAIIRRSGHVHHEKILATIFCARHSPMNVVRARHSPGFFQPLRTRHDESDETIAPDRGLSLAPLLPALSTELRRFLRSSGGIRTRDLVIHSDVVPSAFVTCLQKLVSLSSVCQKS
jgi:hypothetical protein